MPCACGGATINDVVIHAGEQPHGLRRRAATPAWAPTTARWASTAFTHYKSTMKKSTLIETGIRNPPFNEKKMRLLKLVMPGK